MKVYSTNNGINNYMVAAESYKEAARLMACTVGDIKNYGGIYQPDSAPGQIALAKPGVVWERRAGAVTWVPQSSDKFKVLLGRLADQVSRFFESNPAVRDDAIRYLIDDINEELR